MWPSKRGPIVYCLESIDLPEETLLSDIRIPSDVSLEPHFEANLLQGVTVLKGTASSRPTGDWNGKLYRSFNQSNAIPIPMTFIPYYAWANRGESEMSIWLPLDH